MWCTGAVGGRARARRGQRADDRHGALGVHRVRLAIGSSAGRRHRGLRTEHPPASGDPLLDYPHKVAPPPEQVSQLVLCRVTLAVGPVSPIPPRWGRDAFALTPDSAGRGRSLLPGDPRDGLSRLHCWCAPQRVPLGGPVRPGTIGGSVPGADERCPPPPTRRRVSACRRRTRPSFTCPKARCL